MPVGSIIIAVWVDFFFACCVDGTKIHFWKLWKDIITYRIALLEWKTLQNAILLSISLIIEYLQLQKLQLLGAVEVSQKLNAQTLSRHFLVCFRAF